MPRFNVRPFPTHPKSLSTLVAFIRRSLSTVKVVKISIS